MCLHTTVCVLILLYVFSYYCIYVLILLYMCPQGFESSEQATNQRKKEKKDPEKQKHGRLGMLAESLDASLRLQVLTLLPALLVQMYKYWQSLISRRQSKTAGTHFTTCFTTCFTITKVQILTQPNLSTRICDCRYSLYYLLYWYKSTNTDTIPAERSAAATHSHAASVSVFLYQ